MESRTLQERGDTTNQVQHSIYKNVPKETVGHPTGVEGQLVPSQHKVIPGGKIYLYTETLFWKVRGKTLVKKLLGRNTRGPQAVQRSLFSGLSELGIRWSVNARFRGQLNRVGVLAGLRALQWAIEQKRAGRIRHIFAGPNLAVSPLSNHSILQDPAIDIVLVPSQWVFDQHASQAPSIRPKLRIWAAGVHVPEQSDMQKEIDFLIFNKIHGDSSMSDRITEYLQGRGYTVKVLAYGMFDQLKYWHLLDHSKHMIYLSESESQGLAMAEAWARNVPTLVWERGFWAYGGHYWKGNTASPYVTEENGMRFRDYEEFVELLPLFINTPFAPREYVRRELSDKISAEKYLAIYQSL